MSVNWNRIKECKIDKQRDLNPNDFLLENSTGVLGLAK